jgi:hypothetical protein
MYSDTTLLLSPFQEIWDGVFCTLATTRGLDHLGFGNLDPTSIQKMDVVENMSALAEISKAASSGHKGHF